MTTAGIPVVQLFLAIMSMPVPAVASEAREGTGRQAAPAMSDAGKNREQLGPGKTSAAKPERISAIEAVILGAVEGITEFLPISSTGHLIIVNKLLSKKRHATGGNRSVKREDLVAGISTFEIVIQFGAILAVFGLYRVKFKRMVRGIAGRDPAGLRLLGLLLLATAPAALAGLVFHSQIKDYLFTPAAVAVALAVGGIIMIVAQLYYPRRKNRGRTLNIEAITWRQGLVIGIAQIAAMWPGTSRSMITIVAGLLVGLNLVASAEFSFLLAIPTLGAATVFEMVSNMPALLISADISSLLIGIAISGIIAAIAIKWFVNWLTRHGLVPFGIYRILLAAAVCAYFLD